VRRHDHLAARCDRLEFTHLRISALQQNANVLMITPGGLTNLRHRGPAFSFGREADVELPGKGREPAYTGSLNV